MVDEPIDSSIPMERQVERRPAVRQVIVVNHRDFAEKDPAAERMNHPIPVSAKNSAQSLHK